MLIGDYAPIAARPKGADTRERMRVDSGQFQGQSGVIVTTYEDGACAVRLDTETYVVVQRDALRLV